MMGVVSIIPPPPPPARSHNALRRSDCCQFGLCILAGPSRDGDVSTSAVHTYVLLVFPRPHSLSTTRTVFGTLASLCRRQSPPPLLLLLPPAAAAAAGRPPPPKQNLTSIKRRRKTIIPSMDNRLFVYKTGC